jgi:hypothetical protein
MRRLFIMAVLLAMLAAPAHAKVYTDEFDPARPGILGGIAAQGREGGWVFRQGQGFFEMANPGEPGKVQFFHVSSVQGEPSRALRDSVVTVQVGGDFPQALSGAGLIYRYDPAAHTYWAFVVGGRGNYAVYKRGAGGLRRVMGGTHPAIKTGQPNLLFIGPAAGGQVIFAVNGQKVATLSSSDITGSAVGILAISPGRFRFQRFRLETPTP